MASRRALLLVCVLISCLSDAVFIGPMRPVSDGSARTRHACRRCSLPATVVMSSADDLPAEEPPEGGGLISPTDLAKLRSRIAKIQEEGLTTPAQKLFELATQKPPQMLLQEFFATTSPQISSAMQEAVTSLLGALPTMVGTRRVQPLCIQSWHLTMFARALSLVPQEFDSQLTTTGDKLAALMLQLQMTGYMLRNAEYVMALRQVLQLQTRSTAEFRATFDRIDLDQSGYIETAEVEELLSDIYKGDVPAHEVSTFLSLFDTDGDGRIRYARAHACGMGDGELSLPSLPPSKQRGPQSTPTGPLPCVVRLAAGKSSPLRWAPPMTRSLLAARCRNSTPTAMSMHRRPRRTGRSQ